MGAWGDGASPSSAVVYTSVGWPVKSVLLLITIFCHHVWFLSFRFFLIKMGAGVNQRV